MQRPTIATRIIHLLLVLDLILFPAITCLAANIPGFYGSMGNLVQPSANQLPVIQNIVSGVSGLEQVGNNRLIVHQDESKAVLDWQSFDIGANAWTHFDQQGNTNWAALNRIYDKNPSQIFGRLTADGKVYLINQNGMLFSEGSTVDVHGLVASSLSIALEDFEDDLMSFAADNYQNLENYDTAAVAVSNHGTITTDNDGSILLIGPTVENYGTISSPVGEIILASGTNVGITKTATKSVVSAEGDAEVAVNAGNLEADMGAVGLYGRIVNQEGLIKAVTAVSQGGAIRLEATERLTLGEKSETVTPISDSDETLVLTEDQIENFGGTIDLIGGDMIILEGSAEEPGTTGALVAAPSGTVTVEAVNRVYLGSGSTIDVSGAWAELSADAAVASVQLNSVELKDDQLQKESILQGQTIYFNTIEGSGIGDVSGTLETEAKTAREFGSTGGDIVIAVDTGDVIACSGATLDFSGGGVTYAEGFTDTTVVVCGAYVYRIEDASDILTYDAIIGPDSRQTSTNERFGISNEYEGTCYFGGANSIHNFSAGYSKGADAGSLEIDAPQVIINASLNGSVSTGSYQTEDSEGQDEYGQTTTNGIQRPTAGELIIGNRVLDFSYDPYGDDQIVRELIVKAETTALGDDFDPTTDLLMDNVSIISAEILNAAKLSKISLAAVESIIVESDTAIVLDPDSSISMQARHVEHNGSIVVPGGSVTLELASNFTSDPSDEEHYISAETLGYERIYLASDSVIDVSGEQIDQSQSTQISGTFSYPVEIGGGSVSLMDYTQSGEGIIVMAGASIDASGGWQIEADGTITGGDAGTIEIAGSNIFLEGELCAYALDGADGGELILHAEQVTVSSMVASLLPDNLGSIDKLDLTDTQLIITPSQIDAMGVTNIQLVSVTDLSVDGDVTLSPSTLKLSAPDVETEDADGELENLAQGDKSSDGINGVDLFRTTLDQIGESTITLSAGEALDGYYVVPDEITQEHQKATLNITSGAVVSVAPEGGIVLSGPCVDIAGQITALAGDISLSATSTLSDMALTIRDGSTVSAAAYNLPVTQLMDTGLAIGYDSLDGGTISIEASRLIIENGALLDVSGSEPVDYLLQNADGTYQVETETGAPGTIEIAYTDEFQLDGKLKADKNADNLQGGTLILSKLNISSALELGYKDFATYIEAGFDDVTLASYSEILFTTSIDVSLERKLTIDSPVVSTSGQSIAFEAPWIELTNTYLPGETSPIMSDGEFSLNTKWIEITGDIILSGFNDVSLTADHDILLEDYYYTAENLNEYHGKLETNADLVINADRVYPTTQSEFSILTGGDVTTLATVPDPSGNPVYSAGGSLTLEAANIVHMGRWYAPIGELSITATDEDGRIYLGEESVLSVTGEYAVNYGSFDSDVIVWQIEDRSTGKYEAVVDVPTAAVTLAADEVIIRDGSTVDVSGGGEIFGYGFLPGIEGSVNPLQLENRYVIVPYLATELPDESGVTVYLEGNDLIEAGTYTILPDKYAFLDGALIIEDLGVTTLSDGNATLSEEGYAVCGGQMLAAGTGLVTSPTHYYSVRSGADVLAEGNFTVEQLTAGDGGSFAIEATTTILNGQLEASALPAYNGGTLYLSSVNIIASTSGANLPEGFYSKSAIPEELQGYLILDATTISEGGFGRVTIGDLSTTNKVLIESETTLEAANITIAASEGIVVESSSLLSAADDDGAGGVLKLNSPEGVVSIAESSILQGTGGIEINAAEFEMNGDISSDSASLSLASDAISLVGGIGGLGLLTGLVIDGTMWEKFMDIETIRLSAYKEITFVGDLALQAANTLIIDSDCIVLEGGDVTVAASRIDLQNSSLVNEGFADTSLVNSTSGQGSITFVADSMGLSFGGMNDSDASSDATNDLILHGAASLDLIVTNQLIVAGEGTLSTDGDLTIVSAKIVTDTIETIDSDKNDTTTVTTADVSLITNAGTITTRSNGNIVDIESGYGGSITMQGLSVAHNGLIESPAGTVRLLATGNQSDDGVYLGASSSIDVTGTDNAMGGTVSLESEQGGIEVAEGAVVDVSAGGQGDAGTIAITAQAGEVNILGEFIGLAKGGSGGNFSLDNLYIDGFGFYSSLLSAGGFSGDIELRARGGDIAVTATDTLQASTLTVVADSGNVKVAGVLDVSATTGGGVLEISAGQNIVLDVESTLLAYASEDGDGGEISLSSANGSIDFVKGATIKINGRGKGAVGGSVYLRSSRTDIGLAMALDGDITGASEITAEGVAVYETEAFSKSYLDECVAEAANWLSILDFSETTKEIDALLTIIPGIEIRSGNDLIVDEAIDFSGITETYFSEDSSTYGVLTLRSAGDVTINKNLTDIRTNYIDLREETVQNSWGLNLIAGADLKSGNLWALNASQTTGILTIADGTLVYSETGNIRFASAGNTVLGSSGDLDPTPVATMQYSVGSFAGSILGYTGGSLIMNSDKNNASGIQTATGDIEIKIDGDLILKNGKYSGAIRTTGAPSSMEDGTSNTELAGRFWDYTNGGSISLAVGGDIEGQPYSSDAWDAATTKNQITYYHADYEGDGGTRGIVTMAGGSIDITSTGDVNCAIGVFGEGDLNVNAGKDLNGRFLIGDGTASLMALENFGLLESFDDQPIEAFDAQIELIAQGSIRLGTVVNPTIANTDFELKWNLGYSPDSSTTLRSVNGSVTLTGDSLFYGDITQKSRVRILPATLIIEAAENILLENTLFLAPSENGNLSLTAGGDIRSTTETLNGFRMSAADPDSVYGYVASDAGYKPYEVILTGSETGSLLHADDDSTATIHADGDITRFIMHIPKSVEMITGGDITDLYLKAQNNNLDDVSMVYAGGDLSFGTSSETSNAVGIQFEGAGTAIVAAANSIDLGSSSGIRSLGNGVNTLLPSIEDRDTAAQLIVLSGLGFEWAEIEDKSAEVDEFFEKIRELGQAYSVALAEGDQNDAAEILETINSEVIDPFYDDSEFNDGDINMVNSQIYTSGGVSDVYILAAGDVNVGQSAFRSGDGESSGIYTTSGGSINIYAQNDINVNESRVMTFLGGDITAWSQEGDINAGRGSKTALNVSEPEYQKNDDGSVTVVFRPPSVGSGVRALTYDPDGIEGPEEKPEAGNIYLFAPTGEIDAGEAGIAGNNIILAATKVINIQNIEVGGASVGVPDTSLAATSLGALAGSGAVTEGSKIAEEQAGLASAQERFSKFVEDIGETLVPKWIAVEVVGFGEEDEEESGDQ